MNQLQDKLQDKQQTEELSEEVMKVSEIRAMTGLSQSKFAALFGISVRTVQDWEQERRLPPPYVPGMMLKILKYEYFNKESGENGGKEK